MLLSRTLAKRRIARGERPAWLAAWAPVLIDFAFFCGYVAIIIRPLVIMRYDGEISRGVTILIVFVAIFVPMQIVLILSALWASKSRFKDVETET